MNKQGTIKTSKIFDVINNIEKVIYGKTEEIKYVAAAILSEGHILIEDIPGVGKTMLAKAIAKSLGCTFNRIQFTPDLLPSDILGVTIYNQKEEKFSFRAGPIFNQIILADEINRTTPKTQSALLECMEEHQVSLDGNIYKLPRPFLVIATLNPIEHEGTFPLPESQLDRFLIKIKLGYPEVQAEAEMLEKQQISHPISDLEKVLSAQELIIMQDEVKNVHINKEIRDYILAIVRKTREVKDVYLGASPRGSLAIFKASQAWAKLSGRDYCIPDDVKKVAVACLSHRIISRNNRFSKNGAIEIIEQILNEIPVP